MIEPVYNRSGIRLYQGDSRRLITEPLGQVDAVVTDPPYELGLDGLSWDKSGVAFDARFWRRVLMQVVPGGWLLSFGAPRFLGRLQLALEDGGWLYEDTVAWIYGQGWPKGRTRLKPAWEPVMLCRRPGPSRALNVDEAGIGGPLPAATKPLSPRSMLNTRAVARTGILPGRESRYPSNVILDDEAAAELDRQSGFSKSKREVHTHRPRPNDLYLENRTIPNVAGHDDEGGASRFFYVAKPSREEKDLINRHVSVKPVALMRHLVELVSFRGETVLDPFLGSGTTAVACAELGRRFVGMEQDRRSLDVAQRRIYRTNVRGGRHGSEPEAGVAGGPP